VSAVSSHLDQILKTVYSVESYNSSTATLVLKHNYPPFPKPSAIPTVHVDATHILESVKGINLEVGAWVNANGYITWHTYNHRTDGQQERSEVKDLRASYNAVFCGCRQT